MTQSTRINQSKRMQVDLSIFKESSQDNHCKWKFFKTISSCPCLNRIINALRYYEALKLYQNNDKMDIFTSFINDVYNTQLLNDWTHILSKHDDHLQQIKATLLKSRYFKPCSVEKCNFSLRHHQNEQKKVYSSFDPNLRLFAQTLDSAHYHFMHLFEVGLRSNIHSKKNETNSPQFEDSRFAQMVEQRPSNQTFDRYQIGTKFSLANDNDQSNKSNQTFFDELIKNLSNSEFDQKYAQILYIYLSKEEFDSDSIKNDLKLKANILSKVKNEKIINWMKSFIKDIDCQSNTFSIGYRFYYWPKYKKMKKLPTKETADHNLNDHGGYDVCQLFVQRKYENFKKEIFEYAHITFEQYQELKAKAQIFMKTKKVKRLRAYNHGQTKKVYVGILHYDIVKGTKLSLWNLIALSLYTDYSKHCTEFSASFRRLSPFETLEMTKRRNANFWWMAKILRETVELFGQNRYGDNNPKTKKYEKDRLNRLVGPFYCGVNRKMVIPEFNIRLNSPTSTTMQMAVALKFGGTNGTIIQLSNDSFGKYDKVRAFDVSWMSRYPSEDERLFFGGFWRIRVESVRLISSKQNFEKFFCALYYFDAMITGNHLTDLKCGQIEKKMIGHLLKWKMGKKTNEKMHDYIYETFDAFTQHKKEIIIDFYYFEDAEEFMQTFIVHSVEDGDDLRKDSDKTNLIRSEVAALFPNVRSVHIETTSDAGEYSFSLIGFLSVLAAANWKNVRQIEIKGDWIWDLWHSPQTKKIEKKSQIERAYKDAGYQISVVGTKRGRGILIIRIWR